MQRGFSCHLNTRLLRGALEWGTQQKYRSGTPPQVNLPLRNHRFVIINSCNVIFSIDIERFPHVASNQESVYTRKVVNSHMIGLVHQHAAVPLFCDTNIAAVTSYENTSYISAEHL